MSHVLQVNDVTPATARMSTRKVVFIVCFIVASVAIIETAGARVRKSAYITDSVFFRS